MKKTIIALLALATAATADSVGYNSMTAAQKDGVVLAWDFSTGTGAATVGSVNGDFDMNEAGDAALLAAEKSHPWKDGMTGSFADGNFTLNFDLNSFTASNWQALVAMYTAGGTGDSGCLQIGVSNTGDLHIYNNVAGQSGYAGITATGGIDTGLDSGMTETATLTLVSDMVNTKTLTLYIDGVYKGSWDNWTAESNKAMNGIQFGAAFGGSRVFPEAEISNVTLWNKALTATEVKGLMIPEPTTATLSLLALAGLAARRRRK